MHMIDLISDTVTRPTEKMRRAMYEARVGDDVYEEDPTINELEEVSAKILGKEAALFVTSGTMGNLVAVMAHTERGDEIFLEEESHIYFNEVGGLSVVAQTMPRLLKGDKFRALEPDTLRKAIRAANIHFPRPRLLCIENTHNRGGGTVMSVERMAELYEVAHNSGLLVHLDGARIFNAAVALGVDVRELTSKVDTVQVCLSKGLCAPVGSIVAGPKDFIKRARKNRKMLGGGLRQAGVIAAAGLVGITSMVERLKEDHDKAQTLAKGLSGIEGIKIDLESVQSNMVSYDIGDTGLDAPTYLKRLAERKVRCGNQTPTRIRMVTHNDVSMDDILKTIEIVKEAVNA